MATVDLKGVTVISVDNTTHSVPEGFMSASFSNQGDAAASITQNNQTWTLPSGAVFNLPALEGNNGWLAVSIDATGTLVECVYY
jgi:hypothetical protein